MDKKKEKRFAIWYKYGCRCAYCGTNISAKEMQVDHIFPKHLAHWLTSERMMKDFPEVTIRDVEHEDNLNPACASCNNWKHSLTLEKFRDEIAKQIERLIKYSANYRMAKRFGLISETGANVVFYFEKLKATST